MEFIHTAFEAGQGVAVDKRDLGFFSQISVCRACNSGQYQGCYLFAGIAERSRGSLVFDRVAALAAALLLTPLFVVIFLLVLLLDGAPVLFLQRRYGLDNREFYIYKFRTMVLKSEQLHDKMVRRWGREGELFKLDNDPRVTSLGAILRFAYLDELPQLFNVLKGDMRLCGPRPLPESDNRLYTQKHHELRLRGMPGITGLWQLTGRSELSFDEMSLLDVYYLCNNNLRMDLKIIRQTLKLLFTHRG